MGSLCSLVLPSVDLNDARTKNVQERFSLSEGDMKGLLSTFRDVDTDGSGLVDFTEFFDSINEPSKEIMSMIFKMVTNVEKPELDFPSWCQAVLGFCLMTREELVNSIYSLHDVDKNGFLDISEMTIMMENIHRENQIFPSQLTASIVKNYILEDGKLDHEEFKHACNTHPMLLWPIFRTQHRMRTRLLGKKFWKRLDEGVIDTYNQNPDHKGGTPPSEIDMLMETLNLYCCTFCGCYDKERILDCEMEAGQAALAYKRAIGEYEPDKDLIIYQQELEAKRERAKERKKAKADDTTSSDEEVEEIEVKDDDEGYGEDSDFQEKVKELEDRLKEQKEKLRDDRKENPTYFGDNHFDSEWYDYSDEMADVGAVSVAEDEHVDSRPI